MSRPLAAAAIASISMLTAGVLAVFFEYRFIDRCLARFSY